MSVPDLRAGPDRAEALTGKLQQDKQRVSLKRSLSPEVAGRSPSCLVTYVSLQCQSDLRRVLQNRCVTCGLSRYSKQLSPEVTLLVHRRLVLQAVTVVVCIQHTMLR